MWQDPIVEELHALREERSKRCNNDLATMAEESRQRAESIWPAPRVKLDSRKPWKLSDAA